MYQVGTCLGARFHSHAAAPSFCIAPADEEKGKNVVALLRVLCAALLWHLHQGACNP